MLTSEDIQQISQITTKIIKEELTEGLKEGLKPLSQSIDDLAESVAFIKDNAMTKDEFNILDGRVSRIEAKMTTMDAKMTTMDAKMITIDDLSRAVGTVRGDMVQLVRKEDDKVNAVVDSLEEERVLSYKHIETIRSHRVFPAPPSTASSVA